MGKKVSLADYVKRRNGVPLGASGALGNMLKRSLGASSFQNFWRYWNPVWGYYLSRYIMKPLSQWLPLWLATILTFSTSGFIHDIVVSLIKKEYIFTLTPWFTLIGIVVVITTQVKFSYKHYPWIVRALINSGFIMICYLVIYVVKYIFWVDISD